MRLISRIRFLFYYDAQLPPLICGIIGVDLGSRWPGQETLSRGLHSFYSSNEEKTKMLAFWDGNRTGNQRLPATPFQVEKLITKSDKIHINTYLGIIIQKSVFWGAIS